MTHESLYERRRSELCNYIKIMLKRTHNKITMVSTPSPSSGGIFIVFGFPRLTSGNQNLLQSEGHPLTAS